MEERQSEQETFPHRRFGTVLELLDIEGQVGSEQIVLKSFRRFVSQFDSLLEDGHWEDLGRGGGEPHPEVLGTGFGDAFEETFQLRHERGCQVAVLQEDPLALLDTFLNSLDGEFSLALSEGSDNQLGVHAHLGGEGLDLHSRVGPGRQDENQRAEVAGIIERSL